MRSTNIMFTASVHPHACGEHGIGERPRCTGGGSPPRMWGTPGFDPAHFTADRFTPTHVGNTDTNFTTSSKFPVHPHACGEHEAYDDRKSFVGGSPPRMWGTPPHTIVHFGMRRFTPTHVGNTALAARASARSSVHPHACGEHLSRVPLKAASTGSPPRMWGTRKPKKVA